MQHTPRDVPPSVDPASRRHARAAGKSLHAVAIEALRQGAWLGDAPVRQRNLADIAGTWIEDDEFDRAIREQHRVDRRRWR